jgi:hypothetical protein
LAALQSSFSIPAIGIGTLLLMLISAGAGQLLRRWQARRRRSTVRESSESVAQEGYLLSSALGLLGLLLAFSFGLVLSRYEARRELVVKEANAIGTSYLRAQFLDEPYRTRLSSLLVDYAENRIQLASAGRDRRSYAGKNDQLLVDIWSNVRAARESAVAHGMTTALLMTFNEVIDLDAERKVAWGLTLPREVLILLTIFLVMAAVLVGHQVSGPRGRRAALVLFLSIALSITAMVDLNRPAAGWARESQEPMVMLLQSLKAQPPHVFDRISSDSRAGARSP